MTKSQKHKRARKALYKKARNVLRNNVPANFRSVLGPVTVKRSKIIASLIPPKQSEK